MDEPTLIHFVEQGDGVPFVQQSMARRALSEIRRRAWAEMQQQYSVLEEKASGVGATPQANGHGMPTDPNTMDGRMAIPADDPMRKALALSEEALATSRNANASALTSAALVERQGQRIRWANFISVFAAVVAIAAMWRG